MTWSNSNVRMRYVFGLIFCTVVAVAIAQTPQCNSQTNHCYLIVENLQASWTQAVALASQQTYNGQTGYLATVTSSQEQSFLYNNVYSSISLWIGGASVVGSSAWTWITGPEAGVQFATQAGATIPPYYSNWCFSSDPMSTQPAYAQFDWYYPGCVTTADNTTQYYTGYLVEFGSSYLGVSRFSVAVQLGFMCPQVRICHRVSRCRCP